MFKIIRAIGLFFVFLGLTGCAGLGKMKQVEFQTEAKPDMATVNIVRRSVFMGDGAKVEAWDGDEFIGTLGAGKLLQYEAEPGIHTFMVYVQGSWGGGKRRAKTWKDILFKIQYVGLGPNKSRGCQVY